MKLFNNYILVKKLSKQESEGIEYASAVDEFIFKGEVIAIPEVVTDTCPNVGDTVLFLKGAGEDTEIDGTHYKCVKVEDIIMSL